MAGKRPHLVPPSGSATLARPWSRRDWLVGSAAAAALLGGGCQKVADYVLPLNKERRGELKIYTWSGYFPTELFEEFTRQTGWVINPDFPTYSSNAELMKALQEGTVECDLVMPSAFMAETLWKQGLLQPLDQTKIHGLPLATAAIYNPDFDPRNEIIVPYIWGATGIGYDSDRVVGLPKSWSALFNMPPPPRMLDQLVDFRPINGVSVLDDARFTMGSALIAIKKDPNTRNEKVLDEVVQLLKEAPIQSFDTDDVALKLCSGEAGLAMAWSADVTHAMQGVQVDAKTKLPGNKRVRIALPREGSIVFRDSFAIPAHAKNVEGAHALINFFLQPQVAAAVTNYSFYATTVESASAYVERYIVNGPSYFIHPAGQNTWLKDIGEDEQMYEAKWKEVKDYFAARQTGPEVPEPAAEITPPMPEIKVPDAETGA